MCKWKVQPFSLGKIIISPICCHSVNSLISKPMFNLYHYLGKFSRQHFEIFFWFFPEKRLFGENRVLIFLQMRLVAYPVQLDSVTQHLANGWQDEWFRFTWVSSFLLTYYHWISFSLSCWVLCYLGNNSSYNWLILPQLDTEYPFYFTFFFSFLSNLLLRF